MLVLLGVGGVSAP